VSSALRRAPVALRRRRPAAWVALLGLVASGCSATAAPAAPTQLTTWDDVPYRVLGPEPPSLDLGRLVSPRVDAPSISSEAARCPQGMALVNDRFCIDRWEATLLVRNGSREEPHTPYEPVDDVRAPMRAVSVSGVVPQGYVSGTQAEAACRASGKRLCTANEWETACRGSRRAQFPYGNDRKAKACNDDVRATHPVVEAARRLGVPAGETWKEGMNLALVNQLPGGLLPTGAREECVTTEGAFDMVGNLHEWIADPDGTFRGGFYMDTTQNGEGCAYQTTAHDVDYHDYSTGFRCCARADSVE
jgi:sulfatase modifying factor 1